MHIIYYCQYARQIKKFVRNILATQNIPSLPCYEMKHYDIIFKLEYGYRGL